MRPPPAAPANFREWIVNAFGDGIARHFMLPYNAKVWAHPLEEMDVAWVAERVPRPDLQRVLANLLDGRDDAAWGPNARFRYPKTGGIGAVWRRIAEHPRPRARALRPHGDPHRSGGAARDFFGRRRRAIRCADFDDAGRPASGTGRPRRTGGGREAAFVLRRACGRGRHRGAAAGRTERPQVDLFSRFRPAFLPGDDPLQLCAGQRARRPLVAAGRDRPFGASTGQRRNHRGRDHRRFPPRRRPAVRRRGSSAGFIRSPHPAIRGRRSAETGRCKNSCQRWKSWRSTAADGSAPGATRSPIRIMPSCKARRSPGGWFSAKPSRRWRHDRPATAATEARRRRGERAMSDLFTICC